MNPLDAIRRLWADKRKRPLLIAGAGGAAGLGIMAARRSSVDEGVDAEAEQELVEDPGTYSSGPADGTLPPTYVMSSGGGFGYDPAFSEMDLSGVYGEIDQTRLDVEDALSSHAATERARVQKVAQRTRRTSTKLQQQNKRQSKKITQQKRQLKRQKTRLRRVEKKVGVKSRPRRKKKVAA